MESRDVWVTWSGGAERVGDEVGASRVVARGGRGRVVGYRRTCVYELCGARMREEEAPGTPGTGNSHSYSFHGTLVHYFHAYMHKPPRCTRSRDETNRGNEIFYAPEYARYMYVYIYIDIYICAAAAAAAAAAATR